MNEKSRTILYYPISIVKRIVRLLFVKYCSKKLRDYYIIERKAKGGVEVTQTALLVVDIQSGTLAPLIGKEQLVENVNALIDHFHKEHLPIVYIKKVGYGELSQKLHRNTNDLTVTKTQMNTFKAPDFKNLLSEHDFAEFVVVGLMSNACVQATCKGALAEKFPVTLISDAHDSVLKPMRNIWNKKLENVGVTTMTTKEYIKN